MFGISSLHDESFGAESFDLRSYSDVLRVVQEPVPPTERESDTQVAKAFARMAIDDFEDARRHQIYLAFEQDLELRRDYTPKLFRLVRWWLVFAAAFLVVASLPPIRFTAKGFRWHLELEASDVVLVALLGQATATIIGLFIVVARWIFPERRGRDN